MSKIVSTPSNLDLFTEALDAARRINLEEIIDDKGLPVGFRPTIAFTVVIERVQYARKIGTPICLMTGAHGAGKTTALRYIARVQGLKYWQCKPKYEARHVLSDIAQSLGISAGQGWRMQTSIVVEQLRDEPECIIFDEAQRFDYDALDLLKYLGDETGSTFVLAASPSLEERIKRWPDIDSRCGVKARVAAMSLEEFITLFSPDGYSTEALTEMHKVTHGVYRRMHYLLAHLEEAFAASRAKGHNVSVASITPAHVRKLSEKVLS